MASGSAGGGRRRGGGRGVRASRPRLTSARRRSTEISRAFGAMRREMPNQNFRTNTRTLETTFF